ncbi:MAG TPA: CRISPR-associated endonuclease Cas1 [bacterium]
MPTIYVREHGATVGVVNDRIQIRRNRTVVEDVPALHVERIVLMVPAYITQPAVRYLMERGTDVVYVSQNGRFYGQFSRGDGSNVQVRLAQFRKFHEPEFRLKLAIKFITGKVVGIQQLWQRQRRHGGLQVKLGQMSRIGEKLVRAGSLESLRGFEGSATAAHYALLRKALHGEWNFKTRAYHPPLDPVNAMLSLGYTLLYSHMSSLLQMHGVDPYLGFFHEPKRGHAALASDMIEEWRCPMVDALVLRVINTKQITPTDFIKTGKRCTMTPKSLELFTNAFEKRLQKYKTFPSAAATDPVGGLTGQVRQLIRVLLEKQTDYVPISVSGKSET